MARNQKSFRSVVMIITLFILVVVGFSFYSISFASSKQLQLLIYSDQSSRIANNLVMGSQLDSEQLLRRQSDPDADVVVVVGNDESAAYPRNVNDDWKPNSEKVDSSEKSESPQAVNGGSEHETEDRESDRREKIEMMGERDQAREDSSQDVFNVSVRMPTSSGDPPGHAKNGSSSRRVENLDETEEGLPSCKGRFVYIYKLPPQFNEDLLDKCGRATGTWEPMCGNLDNHGYGPLLTNSSFTHLGSPSSLNPRNTNTIFDPPHAWFNTEQFSLDVIFHHRMMKSYPCLTNDPSLAHLFYIPFYAALDSALTIFSPHLHLRDKLIQRLIGWLDGSPTWNRFKDIRRHFIVLGRITWDFSRSMDAIDGWGSAFFAQPELFRVTKLLIERKTWSSDEISIPYPTSFHPHSNQDVEFWLRKVKTSKRKLLFSFIGSKSRGNKWSKNLREKLGKQCENVGNKTCIQATCGSYSGALNTIDCVKHPEHVIDLFLKTIFCLQPPGDSPTRKSLFDSLIAGCIPVFFSTSSAYDQYTWHLPHNGSLYSVFLDGDDVINGHVDIVATLASIAKDIPRLRQMQREVISMLPHLVYASPNQNITNTAFHDVVDITIDNLLRDVPIWQ